MKYYFLIFLSLFISATSFAQKRPVNLKQAVKTLNKECPSELKNNIEKTYDKGLLDLIYIKRNSYKTINEWTADSFPRQKLVLYFDKKGITAPRDQQLAIMLAFKKYLNEGSFNEKEILGEIKEERDLYNKEQSNKYSTEKLEDVYIPKDLADCFYNLDTIWEDDKSEKLKKIEENQHFGVGLWMRNNWGFWGGSRLSKYFNDMGIYHPDDMSGIILDSYEHYLKDEDLHLEEQVAHYKSYWEKAKAKDKQKKDEEFALYKVGGVVSFKYHYGYVSKEQEQKYDDDSCIAQGVITEIDTLYYSIKVRLTNSCDKKGIISYDNIDTYIYNEKTKKYRRQEKREISRLKSGKEAWFNYAKWEPKEPEDNK